MLCMLLLACSFVSHLQCSDTSINLKVLPTVFIHIYTQAHNYSDGRLAILIELNDYVTMVLSKVDMVTADATDETPHATHETRSPTHNERLRMGLSSAAGGAGSGVGGAGLGGSGGRGLLGSSSAANNAGRKLGDGSAFTVLPPQVCIVPVFRCVSSGFRNIQYGKNSINVHASL